MKKSYHSTVVPTRLASATRRTAAGSSVDVGGLCVIAGSLSIGAPGGELAERTFGKTSGATRPPARSGCPKRRRAAPADRLGAGEAPGERRRARGQGAQVHGVAQQGLLRDLGAH